MKCLLALAGALALLVAACAGRAEAPLTSGIQGQVLLGPQCPVVREGTPCPDQPLQATVVAWNAGRTRKVRTFTTDDRGRFRVPLRPGDYYLDPQPTAPDRPFPAPRPETVTVPPGRFVDVTIEYDTGIR
ncbi:MAG TPA: hypothetical protein VFT91_02590 [Dehalococcoidia bacterium]|nr:hypothetical protein [Dehalococcoidia bacterium]